ncbi:MAG: diacylglycerol kinase family protein [Flavobacteriales bacterium]|nr:diacylglycerol kinase family protein [Flavobacteriales bacterium]
MRKFLKSFVFVGKGLLYAIKTQPNFRFELFCCMAVIFAGFYFQITAVEWLVCLLCMAGILVAELINTSIETLTDLVSPEYNPLAGKAKDLAAAAVFLAAVFSAVAGLIIFVPYLAAWF